MVKKIIWTPEAEISFNSLINYLEMRWSEREIFNLIERVNRVVEQIKRYPLAYPLAGKDNIRGAFITKQTLLLYRVKEEILYLLYFWDNRRNPTKKFESISVS